MRILHRRGVLRPEAKVLPATMRPTLESSCIHLLLDGRTSSVQTLVAIGAPGVCTPTHVNAGSSASLPALLYLIQIGTGGHRSGVLLVIHAGLDRLGGDTGRAYQQLNGLLVPVRAAGVPAAA